MTRIGPNLAIAAAAAVVVAIEVVTRSQARYGPECVIVALALVFAWPRRTELDFRAVVGIGVALPAAIAIVHLARGVGGDIDIQSVYPTEGRSLLNGTYPHSEYPPGAVVLFAAEDWVRSARTVNPFVMALAEGAVAASLCSLRTAHARWLAAFVVLWPASAFFWEFKFDALPTAFLVVALAVALRDRWTLSGALLGLGAAVKWSPAVAAVLLAAWLISRGRRHDALRHAAGFGGAFTLVVAPFLIWSPGAVWASISRQAPRAITPESLWYLPLRAAGLARMPGAIFDAAGVPHWANSAVVAVQVGVIVVLAALVTVRSVSLSGAVAVASAGPASFLLLNKVFSAQYVLTIVAALCFGAALVGRPRGVAALLAVAAAANVLVYPVGRFWQPASAFLFVAALVATVWVVAGAVARSRYPHAL